jgi:lysophospholipase L1-like esterase
LNVTAGLFIGGTIMNTIFWAGDSTVQTNYYMTYPQTGIGQAFLLYIKDNYRVENHAKNGRSTKSFIDEGRLDNIEARIKEGDFLFIQFGHNDEKINDPSRYTHPFTTFKDNLGKFIDTARSHGAYPVLITPLERRCFDENGVLGLGQHGDYVKGMKQAAAEYNVPLIDLYEKSRESLKDAGEKMSRRWYMYFEDGLYENYPDGSKDNTHQRYDGAVHWAGIIAEELKKLGGIYSAMIRDSSDVEDKFRGLEK